MNPACTPFRFAAVMIWVAWALSIGFAAAQVPPGEMATPIALKAARLFDSKTGTLRTNGVVVVQGNKIVAAGSGAPVPSNARVVDLGDATLLPGLIDSHTHV